MCNNAHLRQAGATVIGEDTVGMGQAAGCRKAKMEQADAGIVWRSAISMGQARVVGHV